MSLGTDPRTRNHHQLVLISFENYKEVYLRNRLILSPLKPWGAYTQLPPHHFRGKPGPPSPLSIDMMWITAKPSRRHQLRTCFAGNLGVKIFNGPLPAPPSDSVGAEYKRILVVRIVRNIFSP